MERGQRNARLFSYGKEYLKACDVLDVVRDLECGREASHDLIRPLHPMQGPVGYGCCSYPYVGAAN